jgi:hypothetical protein
MENSLAVVIKFCLEDFIFANCLIKMWRSMDAVFNDEIPLDKS